VDWSTGGSVNIRQNEPNALAGTVSKCVLQINRLNSGGSGAYDGGSSSTFAVTPLTTMWRVAIYSHRLATYESA
jgi:hypothetical protein